MIRSLPAALAAAPAALALALILATPALATAPPTAPTPAPPAPQPATQPAPQPVPAARAATPIPAPPTVTARSWILMDHFSGRVLAQEKSDERAEPASLTKLLTAYVVFAALAEGRL